MKEGCRLSAAAPLLSINKLMAQGIRYFFKVSGIAFRIISDLSSGEVIVPFSAQYSQIAVMPYTYMRRCCFSILESSFIPNLLITKSSMTLMAFSEDFAR